MKIEIRTTILPPLVVDLDGGGESSPAVAWVKPAVRVIADGGATVATYSPAGDPGEWSPVFGYVLAVVVAVGVAAIGAATIAALSEVLE